MTMADTNGYLIGPKLLAEIRAAVQHYANIYGGGEGSRPRQQDQRRVQVILMEDLLAAVDTLTDPSTAKARVLAKKTNGDLEITTREITIVNRFLNISIDSGIYGKAEWIDGEWQLYAADCPAQSQSMMSMGMSMGGGGEMSSGAPPPGGP
jgi:hypothetical protein